MAEPKVSVIIPVHNRADLATRCVASVLAQDYAAKEVIVVDDASTDGTRETLQAMAGVRLIARATRGGPGAARNAGVEASRGDLIVFLDSDCRAASPDWLSRHVGAHAPRDDLLVTGMVKGLHRTYGGAADSRLNWFMFSGKPRSEYTEAHMPMANASLRRTMFDRVGPFLVDLPVMEDVDWSYRARSAGACFRLAPEAVVYHQDREGLMPMFHHQRRFGYCQATIRRLHPESRYAWLFPRSLLGSLVMFAPIGLLMTVYVIGKALPRDPAVLWYAPGIAWGHIGHCWGIMQWFRDERKRKNAGSPAAREAAVERAGPDGAEEPVARPAVQDREADASRC